MTKSIELLRIISMIFVMLIHVKYALDRKNNSMVDTSLCVIVQWITMICVDLFKYLVGSEFIQHLRESGSWFIKPYF